MVKKTTVQDNVNKTEQLPEKMNTIKVYGLLPTVEFQKVKCCAEVIILVIFLFNFSKILSSKFLSILAIGSIQKSAESFQRTCYK